MDDILIVTTNDVPGYEITQVHGEICGLIVRARNVFSNVGRRACAPSSAARRAATRSC